MTLVTWLFLKNVLGASAASTVKKVLVEDMGGGGLQREQHGSPTGKSECGSKHFFVAFFGNTAPWECQYQVRPKNRTCR